jgi:hypothetical protein
MCPKIGQFCPESNGNTKKLQQAYSQHYNQIDVNICNDHQKG